MTCRDCAGMTAQASNMKRDLYGEMLPVTAADVRTLVATGYGARCETCGARAVAQ